MKKTIFSILAAPLFLVAHAQPVDSIRFFTDESIAEMTLTTDFRKLQNEKKKDIFQEASVEFNIPGQPAINEKVQVTARGNFRRENCKIPPIKFDFRNASSPRLAPLGKLKLVLGCGSKADDEQLLLKEYLVYKIYNMLEEKSFRVRLLKANYNDSKGKNKPFTQYSFLIEDDADMARRNGCRKKDVHPSYHSEQTNRKLMTKVALFQYMIGNTDWAVPKPHNIQLIFERKDDSQLPYPVPYDFDYCGLVDAGYAIPSEVIGTESVTERVYRGFPRTMEELQESLDVFRQNKDKIFSLVAGFEPLNDKYKKQVKNYLEEFFKMIENKNEVKRIFIDNARST